MSSTQHVTKQMFSIVCGFFVAGTTGTISPKSEVSKSTSSRMNQIIAKSQNDDKKMRRQTPC